MDRKKEGWGKKETESGKKEWGGGKAERKERRRQKWMKGRQNVWNAN